MKVINLKEKQLEHYRQVYLTGITDKYHIPDKPFSEKILKARHELIIHADLGKVEDKINIIISFFITHKYLGYNLELMYIIFSQALEFILVHDNVNDLKEKFVPYCDFLFEFVSKEKNLEEKINQQHFYNFIKILSFDIQTALVKQYLT